MHKRTKDDMMAIHELVEDYLKNYEVSTAQEIIDYIEDNSGIVTTRPTVTNILQSLGYYPKREWSKE